MRDAQEIKERIDEIRTSGGPLSSFSFDALAEIAPWEAIEHIATEGVDREAWEEDVPPLSRDSVIDRMRSYMSFAWGKALDHRGISASRSVMRYREWLWVLEDDELMYMAEADSAYPNYGCPILLAISEKYGFDVPDDEAARRMARGEACSSEGCLEGC